MLDIPHVVWYHLYFLSDFTAVPYSEHPKAKENSSKTLKWPWSFLQVRTIKKILLKGCSFLEHSEDSSKEDPTLSHYLHCLYLMPFFQTVSLSPISEHSRHQQPSTVQNGGCEGKRLEGGCLERRDFSQDSFSTTNLLIFWANKCSEHRRFIFKRH